MNPCVALSICSASLLTLVNANAFLGGANPTASVERVSVEHVEQSLLAELAGVFNKRRPLAWIEDELRPMYTALPKGPQGSLESSTVRYALHRHFVERHGWYMKGLEPAGNAWSNLTASGIAKEKVPVYIQSFFEKRVGKAGLGLRELAVFVATLEVFVQEEAADSLRAVYHALQLPTVGSVAPEQVGKAIGTHLMIYVVGNVSATLSDGLVVGNVTARSFDELPKLEAEAIYMYPAWPDMAMWAEDVRQSVAHSERQRRSPFSVSGVDFYDSLHVLAEVTERFGKYQDVECRQLKEGFMDHELKGTGRLLLSDFWGEGLGDWQFTESLGYLRELGALDESNPLRPTVIIPNYLYSPSNCVASSGFYSVCCRDECEGLLAHLERKVAAPTAEPKVIADIVSALPSDTVLAPRNLSSALLGRLADIAAHHGGRVPLHGRLFAQWLHHAYPRECPFPHVSGTTNPQTADEWMDRTGQEAFMSEAEMARSRGESNATSTETVAEPLPWTAVEELVGVSDLASTAPPYSIVRGAMQGGTFFAALVSIGVVVVRTMRATSASPQYKLERLMV